MTPKVSVVVPVFNCEEYIKRCVDSILAQTLQKLEIILVNDGSTDNSGTICREYANKFDNVLVVEQPNGGASKARLTGIRISKGEYIGFVDSDDWVHPNMYECMYSFAIQHDVDIVQCGLKKTKNPNDQSINYKNNSLFRIVSSSSALRQLLCVDREQNFNFLLWNKLFKRNIFDNFEYPVDIKIINDVPVVPRTFYYATRIAYTEQPLVYYFERNDSKNKSLMDQMSDSKLRMIYFHIEAFYDVTNFFANRDWVIYQYSIYLLFVWVCSGIKVKGKSEKLNKIIINILFNVPILKNSYIPLKYKIYYCIAKILYVIKGLKNE